MIWDKVTIQSCLSSLLFIYRLDCILDGESIEYFKKFNWHFNHPKLENIDFIELKNSILSNIHLVKAKHDLFKVFRLGCTNSTILLNSLFNRLFQVCLWTQFCWVSVSTTWCTVSTLLLSSWVAEVKGPTAKHPTFSVLISFSQNSGSPTIVIFA